MAMKDPLDRDNFLVKMFPVSFKPGTKMHSVRQICAGDNIGFLCNGRGRGGHYSVRAKVTKVNRKTLQAIEIETSYSPGTPWTIHLETEGLHIIQYEIKAPQKPKKVDQVLVAWDPFRDVPKEEPRRAEMTFTVSGDETEEDRKHVNAMIEGFKELLQKQWGIEPKVMTLEEFQQLDDEVE